MTDDHEAVRDLLVARSFGALDPADEQTVRTHLAGCAGCAAQAARLREAVRLLDGPPLNAPAQPADSALSLALRTRPAAARAAGHAAPYAAAVAGLKALLPELEGRWSTPVVHDWDAHATVAHLLAADEHLAGRLGIAPRVPPSRIEEGTPWEEAWNRRTADVIAHEHGRTPQETAADWAAQADALLATDEARDAELAARAVTLMGMRLPVADHFLVRAFEAWVHTDDIGRAIGLAVPPPPQEHLGQLVRLAVRVLSLSLGPAAPPVLFSVTGGAEWVLGSDAEPVRAELILDPVDFCLLVGGRYAPEAVPRRTTGDAAAVRNVLERAASLSWL
ncbi:maleylpyruvate isomerase family mycothiol-dependent enzyme [Streptomyces blattellae]|uniref:maleylpyruvate isomerase family mycothiol-dependent enzyme n=1 Tax=Streptomyces blattellae TaxID=2569855 RepID=UPI0012B93D8D|nr:maleylpyruvate isomerase family mycothiol-dependent enzyme [Streptomyces blattellae]